MPIKTLHITNSWHARSGGIATFYRALIETANRREREIRLIVPGESNRVDQVGRFGKIHSVKAPRAPMNSDYRVIYPAEYLTRSGIVRKILAEERPDVVEICDKYTLNYLGALLRRGLLRELNFCPVVVGLSCERMDDNFRAYVGKMPFCEALCAAYLKWAYFPFFDHHIANSEYTSTELRKASRGHMVVRNVWIRPMGVDLEHFSPGRRSKEQRRHLWRRFGGDEATTFLIYAGRLAPEKNLTLLFEAFAELLREARRDYRLLIVGDGVERTKWEGICGVSMPGVTWFLGHLQSREELADFLANSDVFVHPNHREPFGIAPLEAMASGLPLVAPDRGGVTSYADSDTAWVAPPDAASFAAAIGALLDDEGERKRRTENARRRAAEFSWQKTTAAFLDLYDDLHRARKTQGSTISLPAISSTPARGLQLAFSRGVALGAEKIAGFAANLDWRTN